MLGATFAVGIEQNTWRAFCQCLAVAHALMAVLKSCEGLGYKLHWFNALGFGFC